MTLIQRLTSGMNTDEGDEGIPNFPDPAALLRLSDQLLYSSSLVDQTYYHLYDGYIPKNAPDRYSDLAVYQQRRLGVGTRPLSTLQSDGSLDDETVDEAPAPPVLTATGSLTIHHADDAADMLEHTLTTDHGTYTAFGSLENYHPTIQAHMVEEEEYSVSHAWATIIEINDVDDEHAHFCQLALDN